jgi:hypothetical protein
MYPGAAFVALKRCIGRIDKLRVSEVFQVGWIPAVRPG